MAESAPFSVLLPVYGGDVPAYVERAVISVTTDQTLRPTELVIVVDGPVGPGLTTVLDRAGELAGGVPVRFVALPENLGLARALEAGLAACAHEVVARADADDISLPSRFARQVPLVAGGVDLLGSAITEFEADERSPGLTRSLPTDAGDIAAMARFRDPFNHPSVVYRRSAVRLAGGYEHVDKMEDYWLFVRMIATGARVANLPESLVLYRVGAGAYGRRGGGSMLRSELRLQSLMLRAGFTSWSQALRNVIVRGGYRFVPAGLRRLMYKVMVTRR
ncbi:MAG: glycosyltransferase [Actinomycetes bacterium]